MSVERSGKPRDIRKEIQQAGNEIDQRFDSARDRNLKAFDYEERLQATWDQARAAADYRWMNALSNVPGITPNMMLEVYNERKRLFEEEMNPTDEPKAPLPPKDELTIMMSEGTPVQELEARYGELSTKRDVLQADLDDTIHEINSLVFTSYEDERIQKVHDLAIAKAESVTDMIWARTIAHHPNVAHSTAVELFDAKGERREREYDKYLRYQSPEAHDDEGHEETQ